MMSAVDLEEWTNDMISYKMIEYYKYKYLSDIVGLSVWIEGDDSVLESLVMSTLVSCLVYYDIGGQVGQMSKILDTMHGNICLDGIYNFRMRSIRDSWAEMGDMLEDLDSFAIENKDILAVTRNLYGVIKDKSKVAIVQSEKNKNTKIISINTENERICSIGIVGKVGTTPINIDKIWATDSENIIATLIKHRIGVVELDKKHCFAPLGLLKNLFVVKCTKRIPLS